MVDDGEVCAPKDLDEKMEHSRLHYCQIIECGCVCEGESPYKEMGKREKRKL